MPKVRLIDEKNKQLGVVSLEKAFEIARVKRLDLVEVQPKAQPPVVKMLDFAKFQYRQKKGLKKLKQKTTKLKGVRFGFRTSEHDLSFKAKRVGEFLKKGFKVRIQMLIKGREKSHPELAKKKLKVFLDMIPQDFEIEQEPKRHPMGIILIIRSTR